MTPFGCMPQAVVAVAGDHLVAFVRYHLHAEDDGLPPM